MAKDEDTNEPYIVWGFFKYHKVKDPVIKIINFELV